MLEDLKQEYERCADLTIPDWRNISKSDLCRAYVEHQTNPQLRDGYFSAIIVKYWNILYRYKVTSPGFNESDFYTWLVRALTYILNKHPWDREGSAIYGDPQGPDKAVNRCLKSTRLIFYDKSNTFKRRANMCIASIEDLEEKYKDATLPQFLGVDPVEEEDITAHIIRDTFKHKNYFAAFMVFNIVAKNPFDKTIKDGADYLRFSEKKLTRYMHNIDENTCKIMAEEFNFNLDEVRFGASTCTEMSLNRIRTAIRRNLKILGNSKYLEHLSIKNEEEV